MAQQTINVGAAPNDGTGTPLRTAFQYTNSNFTELYTATGPSGNNINVPGAATITGDLTVDTSTLKVDSANNRVGIGTASPAVNLEIGDGTGTRTLKISGATNIFDIGFGSLRGGSTYGDVRLWTDRFRIYNAAGTQIIKNIDGTNGDETWYDGAGGTRMTLNSTGLGVGVSPSYKLDVQGADNSIIAQFGGTSRKVNFTTSANGGFANGFFNFVSTSSVGAFSFQNASGTLLTIDSGGNVGIGATPSAWASKALQVGVYAGLHQNDSLGSSELTYNCYRSTGSTWNYIQSDTAARYRMYNSTHAWFIAASGTAGNAITFTQAMTLDASGRLILLASTTTPATLATNGELTFTATSNTNLRFSYRGSDGTTRTADITLA